MPAQPGQASADCEYHRAGAGVVHGRRAASDGALRRPGEPFSPLGASFLVDIEAGYALPFLGRAFAVVLDAGFTQPTASGSRNDPRIDTNGGNYTWQLTQQEVLLGLTVFFRLNGIMGGRLVPFAGVGPRMWLLKTHVQGAASGDAPIPESTEQSTKVGLSVPVGAEFQVGPGRIFGEFQLLWAPIDHKITGDSSVGSLTLGAGYRMQFGL